MVFSYKSAAITFVALLFLGSTVSAMSFHSTAWSRNRTEYVETRVGSGGAGWGIGMLNPGSQVPFGAMRLGPDTSVGTGPYQLSFDQFSGYYYFNDFIECLSHTHVVGAGEGDFQNFGVMVTRTFNDNIIQNRNYRSHYSHQQEVALPGYYAVNLLTPNVFAELTTTGTHTGLHRYTARPTYPEDLGQSYLLIDVCHGFGLAIFDTDTKSACIRAQVVNVSLANDGLSYELDAWIFNKGSFSQSSNRGGIYIYYHAVISAFAVDESTGGLSPIQLTVYSWENDTASGANAWYRNATTSGSLGVGFAPQTPRTNIETTQYTIRAGISFISNANARLNLQAQQTKDIAFDNAVQSAINEWEDHHQSIRYSGGAANNDIRVRSFETALYNVARPPTTYSEANGEYLGEDWNVHNVEAGTRYVSDLSIWDIYRSQAPLLAFIKPTIARDLINSMLEMYKETGALPVWVFANVETYCMVGHHSAIIFADYVMKGLPGINTTAILNAVVSQINLQNTQNFEPYGFVPIETNQRGTSLTLDYALDAGAAANLAAFLNDTAAAATLSTFAKSYRNQWDNSSTYFCPRFANGTFRCGDPYFSYPFNEEYVEGDGAEYRWYVPHDISGLIGLFPNATYFVDQLDEFFAFSTLWAINTTLPNPAFWAGNEPDILAPFLFVFAGNEYAYLTNLWVEETLNTYYFPYASGIPGNDDYGTMSAWVVYSHIGFYPVASTDQYALFAPLFDEVEFSLDRTELAASPWASVVQPNATGARTTIIRITATGRPASGTTYVTAIHVNGKLLPSQSVTHAQLVALDSSVAPYTLIEYTLSGEPTVYGADVSTAHGGPSVYVPSSHKWSEEERASHKERFQTYANDVTARLKDGKLSPTIFKKQRMPPNHN